MLGRVKRKFSRTKSVSDPLDEPHHPQRGVPSLTPSDEMLINQLRLAHEEEMAAQSPEYDPSIFAKRYERTTVNSTDSGILSLPTEILLSLKSYLMPSSEVAMRHSCSRFLHLYTRPTFSLSADEKFDYVCMTERDQDPTQLAKLVCGHCRELHMRAAFPSTEVQKPPIQRDCQQIWLCPHRSMGFSKTVRSLKAGVEAPFRTETLDPCSRCREVIRNRSISDRPERGTSQMELDSPKCRTLLVSKVAILQRPSPVYNTRHIGGTMYKEIFGVKDVSAALQALDFRICAHVKLGDPCMLSKFCRSCLNTQKLPPGVKGPPCISAWSQEADERDEMNKCRGACFDRTCKTKWMFQARESLQPDASGRRQVWLIIAVYRWLGPMMSSGPDRPWREHTVTHQDRVLMRKNWDQWSKGRTPMPNWSLCLWNGEDCNLR